jgi:hypothetical protein
MLLVRSASAVEGRGSICIKPIPNKKPSRAAPGLFCDSGNLSMKIDSQEPIAWPRDGSRKLVDLDLTARHQVMVLCDGKRQQTFKFRFNEFKSDELCLFINDLYQTVQLWEKSRSPWCKCK